MTEERLKHREELEDLLKECRTVIRVGDKAEELNKELKEKYESNLQEFLQELKNKKEEFEEDLNKGFKELEESLIQELTRLIPEVDAYKEADLISPYDTESYGDKFPVDNLSKIIMKLGELRYEICNGSKEYFDKFKELYDMLPPGYQEQLRDIYEDVIEETKEKEFSRNKSKEEVMAKS